MRSWLGDVAFLKYMRPAWCSKCTEVDLFLMSLKISSQLSALQPFSSKATYLLIHSICSCYKKLVLSPMTKTLYNRTYVWILLFYMDAVDKVHVPPPISHCSSQWGSNSLSYSYTPYVHQLSFPAFSCETSLSAFTASVVKRKFYHKSIFELITKWECHILQHMLKAFQSNISWKIHPRKSNLKIQA